MSFFVQACFGIPPEFFNGTHNDEPIFWTNLSSEPVSPEEYSFQAFNPYTPLTPEELADKQNWLLMEEFDKIDNESNSKKQKV